jgi:hypothetical protein
VVMVGNTYTLGSLLSSFVLCLSSLLMAILGFAWDPLAPGELCCIVAAMNCA